MTKRALGTLLAIILAGLWGAGLSFAHWRGDAWFLDRTEATMTDLRTLVRGTRTPPQSVTIIAVDDDLVRLEGAYPVARATLARIVDTVAGFGPKAVAVDMLLLDAGSEADDSALAKSLGQTRSVIAAAAVFEDSDATGPRKRRRRARPRAGRRPAFASVEALFGRGGRGTGQCRDRLHRYA